MSQVYGAVFAVWLCTCIVLLLPPEIYCGDLTRCGEVILLDADRPTAKITSIDKHYSYHDGGANDDVTSPECLWYFRSPPGTTIRLDIVASEALNNPVILHDGLGIESNDDHGIQLGGSHESSFISSGRGITCKLPTQSTEVNQEYSVTLQATLHQGEVSIEAANPGECGGTINLNNNSPISDFNVTNTYPSGGAAYCSWYINSPPNTKIIVEFFDWVSLDNDDHLSVYDSTGRIIFVSYGEFGPTPYPVVSDSSTRILFYGSLSVTDTRFAVRVSYTDELRHNNEGVLRSAGGAIELNENTTSLTIQSTNLTSSYVGYMYSYWFVTGPVGRRLKVEFDQLNAGYCTVYDSSRTSKPVSRFSVPSVMPEDRIFTENSATLALYFGGIYEGVGLLFTISITDDYPVVGEYTCGGSIELTSQKEDFVINSPYYYNQQTPTGLTDCWWYVTNPEGKQVQLVWLDYATTDEYVYVYDYPNGETYPVSRLNGNVDVDLSPFVSTRGGITIRLDDINSNAGGRGFLANISLSDAFSWDDGGINSCGQTIHLDSSSPSIVFSTPTYPTEVLNDRYYCYWYLTCPYGYRISLFFDDFETFSSSYFRIYDSLSTSSTYQLVDISSGSMPGTAAIQSSSNALLVTYHDDDWDDVTNQRGVLVTASIIPTGEPTWDQAVPMSSCGGAITLTSQYDHIELSSPDYPSVSGDFYQCTWFVECPSQSTVQIDFNDFWLDSSAYLRVFDGPTTSSSVLLHATGSSLPRSVVSNSNVMTALYSNNRGTSGKGANFAMSCVFEDLAEANVVCDSTSMTVFLDKGLLLDGTVADDVHLVNEDCVGIDHDSTQIVLYTRYDMCSTTVEETEKSIIYSNVVTYYTPQPIIGTEITRENILKIPVQCELDRHILLGDSFVPKTGEIRFNETGYGDFSLQLDRYTDSTFDEPVGDDEGVVTLGEHLYFAVNLTSVTGLTVFIENCWATPSQHPNDDKSYNFLKNGCAEDPTMEMIYSPDPSLSEFVIDAFTFIEESPQVFIHCEVLVCNHNDPSSRCAQGCQTRFRRGSRHTRGTSSIPHLISNGPLSSPHTMRSAEAHQTGGSPVSLESGILIGALAGVTCLVVTMAAILLYMIPSGRTSQHVYRRLNISDDFQ